MTRRQFGIPELFVAVTLVVTAYAYLNFPKAFPLVTLDLRMDRAGALEYAARLAELVVEPARKNQALDLDFSVKSLKQVDRAIRRMRREDADFGQIATALFGFGCYAGEVFVRNAGGQWRLTQETDLRDLTKSPMVVELEDEKLCDPLFKVFNDRVLIKLSQLTPRSFAELGRVKGLPRHMSSKARRALLAVIDAGLRAPPPVRPQRQANNRPDEVVLDRYEALRDWRREQAQTRGVEPDVILSNRILRELAKQNPSSPEQLERSRILNDWERREYGREVVALLRRQARIGPR